MNDTDDAIELRRGDVIVASRLRWSLGFLGRASHQHRIDDGYDQHISDHSGARFPARDGVRTPDA